MIIEIEGETIHLNKVGKCVMETYILKVIKHKHPERKKIISYIIKKCKTKPHQKINSEISVIECMIKHNDIELLDNFNFDLSITTGSFNIINICVEHENIKLLKKHVTNKKIPKNQNINGDTPFMIALKKCDIESLEILVKDDYELKHTLSMGLNPVEILLGEILVNDIPIEKIQRIFNKLYSTNFNDDILNQCCDNRIFLPSNSKRLFQLLIYANGKKAHNIKQNYNDDDNYSNDCDYSSDNDIIKCKIDCDGNDYCNTSMVANKKGRICECCKCYIIDSEEDMNSEDYDNDENYDSYNGYAYLKKFDDELFLIERTGKELRLMYNLLEAKKEDVIIMLITKRPYILLLKFDDRCFMDICCKFNCTKIVNYICDNYVDAIRLNKNFVIEYFRLTVDDNFDKFKNFLNIYPEFLRACDNEKRSLLSVLMLNSACDDETKLNIIDYLIENGININTFSTYNCKAIHVAIQYSTPKIIEKMAILNFEEEHCNSRIIISAIRHQKLEGLKVLLKCGYSCPDKEELNIEILRIAGIGNIDLLEYIVSAPCLIDNNSLTKIYNNLNSSKIRVSDKILKIINTNHNTSLNIENNSKIYFLIKYPIFDDVLYDHNIIDYLVCLKSLIAMLEKYRYSNNFASSHEEKKFIESFFELPDYSDDNDITYNNLILIIINIFEIDISIAVLKEIIDEIAYLTINQCDVSQKFLTHFKKYITISKDDFTRVKNSVDYTLNELIKKEDDEIYEDFIFNFFPIKKKSKKTKKTKKNKKANKNKQNSNIDNFNIAEKNSEESNESYEINEFSENEENYDITTIVKDKNLTNVANESKQLILHPEKFQKIQLQNYDNYELKKLLMRVRYPMFIKNCSILTNELTKQPNVYENKKGYIVNYNNLPTANIFKCESYSKIEKWFNHYGYNICIDTKLDKLHMFPFSIDILISQQLNNCKLKFKVATINNEKKATCYFFEGQLLYEGKLIDGNFEYFINCDNILFHRMFKPS